MHQPACLTCDLRPATCNLRLYFSMDHGAHKWMYRKVRRGLTAVLHKGRYLELESRYLKRSTKGSLNVVQLAAALVPRPWIGVQPSKY
ncbi:hypothetical protein CDV31_009278 [Fusarium ambrosium]|uniref:Uncharacterized protein n=1 Tax=Fusarium ambrosium TaxID=131363 RepID=A0A428TVR6_9HYPO|nr:hypothetical protein CDV31_009278 [Fusarium ambrosium]